MNKNNEEEEHSNSHNIFFKLKIYFDQSVNFKYSKIILETKEFAMCNKENN